MKRAIATLVFATAAFAAGSAFAADCTITPYRSTWSRFYAGREIAADAVVNGVQVDGSADFAQLSCDIATLQHYYNARAGRQQVFLDSGSGVVLVGASGSFLSTGAGAATQGLWTAATLAPVVIGEFNAYEPTRDLYQAAGLGLAALTQRYDALHRDIGLLEKDYPNRAEPNSDKAGGCTAVDAQLAIVPGWGDADRTAFLPAVQAMADACMASVTERRRLEVFANSVHDWGDQLTGSYRQDALGIARQVAAQDRALRYTPMETVSAIAASPFQAIGSALSNENSKAAIEALKSQRTIQALHFQASPLLLATTPGDVALPPDIPAAVLERANIARKAGVRPTADDVAAALRALRSARTELMLAKVEYDRRAQVAQRIGLLARGGDIVTEFDPQTHAIRVKLATASDAGGANP